MGKKTRIIVRFMAGVVVAVCLLATSATTVAVQKSTGPKLTAVENHYDFGSTREGTNVPVKFAVTNTGTKQVRIEKITQAAGCVAPGPPIKNTLAPGESIQLDYIFESLGYGGVAVNKWIKIYYNNTKLSPLELTVTGKVIAAEPYQAPVGEAMYNFSVFIDVESPNGFAAEHVIGAINVPYEQLNKWAAGVSTHVKDNTVIYLCSKDGTKGNEAAQMLRKKGFKHSISLVGGLREWKKQHGRGLIVRGKW